MSINCMLWGSVEVELQWAVLSRNRVWLRIRLSEGERGLLAGDFVKRNFFAHVESWVLFINSDVEVAITEACQIIILRRVRFQIDRRLLNAGAAKGVFAVVDGSPVLSLRFVVVIKFMIWIVKSFEVITAAARGRWREKSRCYDKSGSERVLQFKFSFLILTFLPI